MYFQILWNMLREPMQRALEALVMERQAQGKVQFPPFFQQIIDSGRADAVAHNVLTVLRVRGLAVSDVDRDRILAEKDPARLERWLEKAIVAASTADVLDDANRAA